MNVDRADAEAKLAARFVALGPELNERQRRIWAGAEALSFGAGGIAVKDDENSPRPTMRIPHLRGGW